MIKKRGLIAGIVIVGWLALAAIGGQYFAKIGDLSSTNLNDFLPKNAESSLVNKQIGSFTSDKAIPLIVVFYNDGKELSSDSMTAIQKANERIKTIDALAGDIAPPIQSDDKKAAISVVPLEAGADYKSVFPELKQQLDNSRLSASYTFAGPASFARDLQNAFSGIDSTLLIVALAVVFVILLAVYRSPFLPIIVLGSALAALSTVVLVVYHLADADIIKMNGQVQGILFILVIGAATDYSLLYIARYREELTDHKSVLKATLSALKSSYAAIIAAGATVSVGLLCLLFSDLESNRALGPVGGIGIILAVLATLTLLPSLLLLFGRSAFWPRKPQYLEAKAETHYKQNHPVWSRIGDFVRQHPRRIWILSTLFLLVACVGVQQLHADGVAQSELVVGKSEARDGQKILDTHFPGGSGLPVLIMTSADKQTEVVKVLDADQGIASVSVSAVNTDAGVMPVGKTDAKLREQIKTEIKQERDQQLADIKKNLAAQMAGMPQQYIDAAYKAAEAKVPSVNSLADKAYPFSGVSVKTADGNVLLQAVLSDPADSLTARDTVVRLRDSIKRADSNALVGGTTAIQLDTNLSSQRDIKVIIPLILLAITAILMLLLRAIVAPLVLLVSTILSFGATMGIAALLFGNIWHFAGSEPAVIIYGFVFLVALGIDYNIFLMTRVREETAKRGVAKGTIKGLVVTGGVITSAGIVLAATFASLSVIPILFLVQIAFIVAFGVLLDTLIVRSLLIPALTLEIGRLMWWPSKLWRGKK